MTRRQEIVRELTAHTTGSPKPEAQAFAPANVALCKYGGKRDADLNLEPPKVVFPLGVVVRGHHLDSVVLVPDHRAAEVGRVRERHLRRLSPKRCRIEAQLAIKQGKEVAGR